MSERKFLSVESILLVHRRVIEEFGGDPGIRDRGLLESAISMPHASFAGEYLHNSTAEMAAAYHYHLCSNHPFVDGNKRVAVAAAELFLLINGIDLAATDDELEELTLGLAKGELSKEAVVAFYRNQLAAS